jgi:hypothetical protein
MPGFNRYLGNSGHKKLKLFSISADSIFKAKEYKELVMKVISFRKARDTVDTLFAAAAAELTKAVESKDITGVKEAVWFIDDIEDLFRLLRSVAEASDKIKEWNKVA